MSGISGKFCRTVLVTGASGFIGGGICAELAASGRIVVGLCRSPERGLERLAQTGVAVQPGQATFLPWDMHDTLPLAALKDFRLDGIIHAAGQGDPQSYAARPARVLRDNFLGGVNLLDFAVEKGIDRLVLISSGEVYGGLTLERRIRETDCGPTDPLLPRSAYPVGKMALESLVLAYGRECGLSSRIARLCHVYGPGMSRSDPRIAMSFPLTAAEGGDIVLKSAGDQLRSWCHLGDAARGVVCIMDHGAGGEAYNVADEASELTIRQFAEKVAALAGVKVRLDLPNETERAVFNLMPTAVFDSGKLRVLGWRARVGIDAGLAELVDILRGN